MTALLWTRLKRPVELLVRCWARNVAWVRPFSIFAVSQAELLWPNGCELFRAVGTVQHTQIVDLDVMCELSSMVGPLL